MAVFSKGWEVGDYLESITPDPHVRTPWSDVGHLKAEEIGCLAALMREPASGCAETTHTPRCFRARLLECFPWTNVGREHLQGVSLSGRAS